MKDRSSDIEERLEQPLKYDTPEIEQASLKAITQVIAIAVEGKLICSKTAKNMLAILTINPQARVSRLGQRIALIHKTIQELSNIQDRLIRTAIELTEDIHSIEEVLDLHPDWRKEAQSE